jgi:sugar lactone lactonase YvrE
VSELAVGAYAALAEGIYLEGLAVDHARDVVWYSDVIAGGIHGVKPDGTSVGSFNDDRMWTGGIMMNADGAVLSTGQGGIMWNNPDTGKSGWLLSELEGQPINGINEMWPDGTGGIWFGTNDIEYIIAAKDTRPSTLYRLTVDRQVIRMNADIYFANGIACDPVRGKFYLSDTFRCARVFDVAPDLTLANQQVLLDRDDCDGLALDEEGNVWITGFRSPGILRRLRPDGTPLPDVPTPPGSTTQVRFGGDGHDFYINVVPAGAGDSLKEGQPVTDKSILYRGRSAVRGVLQAPARFRLD